ncbi:hypothetical protein ACFYVR_26420 [Rhodococcus sp. NPDC003318]|uniref:hypothetical protein n=1 Tax=Rhodococcus sp. NPDC003318 TaxID=3364503 RepID=UPI0036AB3375
MNTENAASNGTPQVGAATASCGRTVSGAGERSPRDAEARSDLERVDHILITMRHALHQVESVGPIDVALLERDSASGLVIERVLANLMDMAFDINCHVSRASSGTTPATFAESCEAAVELGLIDAELASELVPVDGPHHVLMQLCLDSEPEQVEAVVARALSAFRGFECSVEAYAGEWRRSPRPAPPKAIRQPG